MGSKGSNTTTTNQTQTYTPNATATNAITGALTQAQNAASLPFSIPQAPVAGFSNDQLSAFNTVNNSQGVANPYYQQAASYFTPQGTQQFFNPYASNVMAGLQNVFGEQQQQATGQLTQAAGGVGADRIAVGQADLANQQGLAAGQTLSNLYGQAASQAQAAGYGQMAAGSGLQNSILTGAQAQLGTGGLQQQLSQAQLNSPYQLALAQAAFPYQQSQFLTGSVGSLAGGLGGTTTGTGTTTQPAPSLLSQILGGAGLATAGLGATGAFGSNGYLTNAFNGTSGDNWIGGVYGGSAQSPLAGLEPSDYAAARGGAINPYKFASGGSPSGGGGTSVYSLPSGFNDQPINVDQTSLIPQVQSQALHTPQPTLNLNPQTSQSGSNSGLSSLLSAAGSIAKIGAMFANRGGTVKDNPYAFDTGGDTSDIAGNNPVIDRGGWDVLGPDATPSDPAARALLEGSQKAFGYDPRITGALDPGEPATAAATPSSIPLPKPDPRYASNDVSMVSAYAPDDGGITTAGLPKQITDPGGDNGGPRMNPPHVTADDQGPANPWAVADNGAPQIIKLPSAPERSTSSKKKDEGSFIDSPWAALAAASLGILGGTSPFAGVNIGQGGMQGLKMLETQRENQQKDVANEQAQRKLDIEAKHYEDQFTRATPYQKWEMSKPVAGGQVYDPATGKLKTQYLVPDGKGGWNPVTMDAGTPTGPDGQPIKPRHQLIGDGIMDGTQPPTTTGLGSEAPAVRAYLAGKKFDLAKAQLEYQQAQKQIQALNGPQMTRGYNLYRSVDSTIDEVKELSEQMKLGGIPFMNKLELDRYVQTQGNSEKGQLTARYINAVNTLKEEFANLANGGYAPTEPAWKLADEQINGNYGTKQLGAGLDEIKRLIGYRMKFIADSPVGPGSANRYTGQGAQPASPAETPAQPQQKPAVIYQDGHEYHLQPDGSYK